MQPNRVSEFYAFGAHDLGLTTQLADRFRKTMCDFIIDCGEDDEYPSQELLATITLAIDELLQSHVCASLYSEGWPKTIVDSVGDHLECRTLYNAQKLVSEIINQDLN